jgi:hypothetical protein
MGRPMVWLGAFAAGIFVGFLVARAWDGEAAPPAPAAAANDPVAGHTVADPASPARPPTPAVASSPVAKPPSQLPAAAPAVAPEPVVSPPAHGASFEPSVDSGVVIPIDAGEVFNKQIARPSSSSNPNALGDAHRALEREARDDGWAYSMEAELQNSVMSSASMGAFKVEHIECRTTLCELRVSGAGSEAAAIRDWSNGLHGDAFGQSLFLNMSSTIADDKRVDAIYILRRPRKP